jgi:competence protein ComEA
MLAWLERNSFLALALAGAFLLSGLAAREVLTGQDAPVLVLQDTAIEPGAPIRVHVSGAVAAPGVYELAAGDRVEDAVAAAGGPAPGADLDTINLARRLRDGEQVRVEGGAAVAPVAVSTGEPLDLNLATQEQLIALPGIGEAYSRRIVDSRAVDGPFASVDEVLERGLVPERTLEGIRAMVTVTLP